jgi:hypothetical protein
MGGGRSLKFNPPLQSLIHFLIFACKLLPPMKKSCYTFMIAFVALTACKKSGKTNSPPASFHKDFAIHESIKGSEQIQNTLGLYQLPDQKQLLFVASRGIGEGYARGFRIGSITKDSAVSWIRSYDLPETYYYQNATCATIDKNQFTWVGGHIFGVPDSYGRPFLVKLNAKGEIVWSKYFVSTVSPLNTARGAAVYALQNGDIAYVTITSFSMILYRLSADGTILWAKSILPGNDLVFDGPFLSGINRYITEAPDGNIYIASTSNYPVKGKNCLVKLSSTGDLVFAKSYLHQPGYSSYPPNIICKENGELIYGSQKGFSSWRPYIYLIGTNGSFLNGKGIPVDRNSFQINELHYNNAGIFLSTTGLYQFNLYMLDASLNVISSEKTLGTSSLYTDEGGASVFDNTTGNWYHLLDIALPGGGNGFQLFKTNEAGRSCHDYNNPPEELGLQAVNPTIKDEISITVQNISFPTLTNLSWQMTSVSTKLETACSK